MQIAGTWTGSYRLHSLEGTQPLEQMTIQLSFRRDWLGRLHGEAETASPAGFPGIGDLHGSYRFGRVRFTWTTRLPYRITPVGFAPLSGGGFANPTGPAGIPAEFDGRLVRSGGELVGTWRIATWMMLAETRRKVSVILARGDWRAERDGDARASKQP